METFTGLLRDLIVAVVGLLIVFDVAISEEMLAGILLVVSTALALGTFAFTAYRRRPS